MKKVAINGFGRIGRACLKVIMQTEELELVAINDLMSMENAVYLLNYDTIYGRYEEDAYIKDEALWVNGKKIQFYSERDPANLPWGKINVDTVIESTGNFTKREDAAKHIAAGARTVVISGPTNSKDTPTVVHGVNTNDGNVQIYSCGSCTTNNVGVIIEILSRRIGIKKAILNTVHAMTASQTLVDAPSRRELRMGRAAPHNLSPASTGAAISVTRAISAMQGKFDGIAIRTPVAIGSISDITFISERATTAEEINSILKEESATERYNLILGITEAPLVSSDIIKSPLAAIVDLDLTKVVDGDLVKVMAWYDNEWGFTNQMIRQIVAI